MQLNFFEQFALDTLARGSQHTIQLPRNQTQIYFGFFPSSKWLLDMACPDHIVILATLIISFVNNTITIVMKSELKWISLKMTDLVRVAIRLGSGKWGVFAQCLVIHSIYLWSANLERLLTAHQSLWYLKWCVICLYEVVSSPPTPEGLCLFVQLYQANILIPTNMLFDNVCSWSTRQ